jgi:hypothetical protein
VTIGMPVYNGAAFLREGLDSLLAQEFKDFELVVSDNASTDQTPEILQEYVRRDSRVRVVRRPETVIAYENFNLVAREATAPLFTWAACDDLREPAFLSRLVHVLDADPGVAVAYCRPRYFGEVRQIRRHHGMPPTDPPGEEETRLARAISVLRTSWWLPIYGLIRTDVLKRSRLFFYPMRIAPDVGLVIEFSMFGTLHCVREVLMATRLHSSSLTTDLSDPIHFGRPGGRILDEEIRAFVDGLPLSPAEHRILMREVSVYCRKAQKPRRFLWRSAGFRSLYVRTSRAMIDLSRRARGL